MKDSQFIHKANYKHLEILHDIEKNSLIKYGHLLSHKVLYPSNIQRQNVKLALKIFNEKNIAALKCIAKDHPSVFVDVDDTCFFLSIFINWWKIVNCKSCFEGDRFNDEFRKPVRANNTLHMNFLQNMSL